MLLKTFLIAMGLLILGYVSLIGLLYFGQRGLIYYPAATQVDAHTTDFRLVRDGVTLRGWRLNPGRPKALIYFGGNAERLEHAGAELTALLPDHTLYLLAYRGYGASEGEPSEAALFGDALALYDHVSAQHPQAAVSVIGRSLGSGVAAYLASKRLVHRLVLVTPFDSLANVAQGHYPLFPVRFLLRDRYESNRYLSHYTGPVLVMRAGHDQVVPGAATDRLLKVLPTNTRVIAFPNADHNDISQDPDYSAIVADFIR